MKKLEINKHDTFVVQMFARRNPHVPGSETFEYSQALMIKIVRKGKVIGTLQTGVWVGKHSTNFSATELLMPMLGLSCHNEVIDHLITKKQVAWVVVSDRKLLKKDEYQFGDRLVWDGKLYHYNPSNFTGFHRGYWDGQSIDPQTGI